MKTSRAARVIHPWRTSGTNAPGYSRPPQPAQAPQGDADDWDEPRGHTVSLGTQNVSQRVQARVAAMTGLSYVDPPRFPKSEPTTEVFIDGSRVKVPSAWRVSISSSRGRDALYVIDSTDTMHVLVIDPAGQLRELSGIPEDFARDLRAWRFPQVRG